MKTKLLYIILAVLITSCTIPMRLFNPSGGFTYKFDGENTGLDTLLNLQGYYISVTPNDRVGYINHNIMFFSNGLLCQSYSDDFTKMFEEGHVFWGRFILSGDTIKGQIVADDGIVGGISSYPFTFLIISPDSIQNISEKADEEKNGIYQFQPLDNELDWRNCWLLKKKWFWKKGVFPKK